MSEISSLFVISELQRAINFAKQRNQEIQIDVAGIQLVVNPKSDLGEIVGIWETEFEKRKK